METGQVRTLRTCDGYRGIWYDMQRFGDLYKYSGGLGTYPQQIHPLAHYAPEVNRTFFVYGGTVKNRRQILEMISYYDHDTGRVPRPRILMNKHTGDAHDNPSMTLDDAGHIWVFASAHARLRSAYVYRSVKPYDIDRFELVLHRNLSYCQTWFVPGSGFLLLHTLYRGRKRFLYWRTSGDGRRWGRLRSMAKVSNGHYQVSWQQGGKIATAFNAHPASGLDARTNLYYLETTDFGETWRTPAGRRMKLPVTTYDSPGLVHDYRAEGLRVYLKNVRFDARGRPVLMFLTASTAHPGPTDVPRTWRTARWTGSRWDIRPITTSDNNYDYGSLSIEPDGTWRLIGPTEDGPQRWSTGGEIALWLSGNRGKTWRKVRQLTRNSPYNHTYVRRPVNAHPDFYAFWADGDALKPSESRLYFTNRAGTHVCRLPTAMQSRFARPSVVSSR